MILINPRDESKKFIPAVINEYFLDLKTAALSMAEKNSRKAPYNEFVYKLKCLEKELYRVGIKLKETLSKNEHLNKEVEAEKEKSRKKSVRIQEMQTQLTSAEFKLRVRCAMDKGKETRDVATQYNNNLTLCATNNYADNATDLLNNLRITALATLTSLRNMILGQGDCVSAQEAQNSVLFCENRENNGDVVDLTEMTEVTEERNLTEMTETISETPQITENQEIKSLKDLEEELEKEHEVKIENTEDLTRVLSHISQISKISSIKIDLNTVGSEILDLSNCSDLSLGGITDDEEFQSKWNDPEFPEKLLRTMQDNVQKLKSENLAIDLSQYKMAQVLEGIKAQNAKINKKIEQYFQQ